MQKKILQGTSIEKQDLVMELLNLVVSTVYLRFNCVSSQ